MQKTMGVTLSVPAREEMLLVVRLTTSGVAARLGYDLETLEDIKTAVYEACYALLHQKWAPGALQVEYETAGGFTARITAIGRKMEQNGRTPDIRLCQCVLETMMEQVEITSDEMGIAGIQVGMPAQKAR